MRLPLITAQSIAADVLARGRELDLQPLTVAVLDSGGHLVTLAREDGASNLRPEIAQGKARGAISMGAGSRLLYERAKIDAYFIQALNTLSHGSLVPVPGGVLIKADDEMIGAVGVTGDTGDNDEICAVHAIEQAGFVADTGG
ncbi:MAG: heme-binding protein [Pseudomonadota bacterium]